MQRRSFLKGAAGAGLASLVARPGTRVLGASERLRLALIGCGGRGRAVARHMLAAGSVEYTFFCDVYDENAARARRDLADAAETTRDFRRVLEKKDIDAVHIATPDHWHAIPAVLACRAGKHVYLEKPLAHNVREGQAIVRAAREAGVVFVTGLQQRSAPHIAQAAEIVRSGRLGNVHFVRVWNHTNAMPDGIGAAPDEDVPAGLDWDFYLGPAPFVPFNRKRFLGTFRQFSDYAGGRITDFGTHRFDSVHQIMGADQPRSVAASGGRFALGGMGDQPDVLQAVYEYPGFILSYEALSTNAFGAVGRITPERRYYGAGPGEGRPNGMAFHGTNGTLLVDRTGWELVPEPAPRARSSEADEGGGSARRAPLARAHANAADATALHAAHFVRAVRDGEASCAGAEIGHRSTLVAHLGNIAYRSGRKLRWDAAREEFADAPGASALLAREPRAAWDLIGR